jgi:hypothetical protein
VIASIQREIPFDRARPFGPGFRVPFNCRIRSTWALVQNRVALPPTSRTDRARILLVFIQFWSVARGTPAAAAASTVVKSFRDIAMHGL